MPWLPLPTNLLFISMGKLEAIIRELNLPPFLSQAVHTITCHLLFIFQMKEFIFFLSLGPQLADLEQPPGLAERSLHFHSPQHLVYFWAGKEIWQSLWWNLILICLREQWMGELSWIGEGSFSALRHTHLFRPSWLLLPTRLSSETVDLNFICV